jgi:hypothetical protein
LHGLGGSSDFFFDEYPMMDLAEQNKYIILAPQALAEQDAAVVTQSNLLGLPAGIDIPTNAVWDCGVSLCVGFILFCMIMGF